MINKNSVKHAQFAFSSLSSFLLYSFPFLRNEKNISQMREDKYKFYSLWREDRWKSILCCWFLISCFLYLQLSHYFDNLAVLYSYLVIVLRRRQSEKVQEYTVNWNFRSTEGIVANGQMVSINEREAHRKEIFLSYILIARIVKGFTASVRFEMQLDESNQRAPTAVYIIHERLWKIYAKWYTFVARLKCEKRRCETTIFPGERDLDLASNRWLKEFH